MPATTAPQPDQAAAASRLRGAAWAAVASGAGGIAGAILLAGFALLRAARSPAAPSILAKENSDAFLG